MSYELIVRVQRVGGHEEEVSASFHYTPENWRLQEVEGLICLMGSFVSESPVGATIEIENRESGYYVTLSSDRALARAGPIAVKQDVMASATLPNRPTWFLESWPARH